MGHGGLRSGVSSGSIQLSVYPLMTALPGLFNVGYEVSAPEALAVQCTWASVDLSFWTVDLWLSFANPKDWW